MMSAVSSFDNSSTQPASSSSSSSSAAATAGAAPEGVFTCNVCQKTFEKRTSRDRHTRRCRNKRPEDTIPRKKSCNHCATSKARCDQRRPQCTRCRTKSLECQYAYQTPVTPPPEQQQHQNHNQMNVHEMGQIDLGFPDPLMLGDVDMNMGGGGDIFAGWGQSCTDSQQLSLTRSPGRRDYFPPTAEAAMQFSPSSLTLTSSSSSSSASPYPEFDLVPFSFTDVQDQRTVATGGDPPSPNTSLIARPPPSIYPQVDLVSRLLGSFVSLLKKTFTAPPFIHRSRLIHRTEPLANVTALVHMTSVKSPENKAFVSAMILAEFYRLEKVLSSLPYEEGGSWDVLEKMQAMVVIALLRMSDGDMELRELNAFENCYGRVGFMELFTKGHPTDEDTWEKWMLAESKRRTFVTVFLLDRLYHYRHGMVPFVCDGLNSVQLPASRNVWEAQSEKEWKEASEAVRSFPGWRGGPQEWVTLSELWDESPRMGAWYAGIDALGTAMMADAVVHTSGAMKHARSERTCNM